MNGSKQDMVCGMRKQTFLLVVKERWRKTTVPLLMRTCRCNIFPTHTHTHTHTREAAAAQVTHSPTTRSFLSTKILLQLSIVSYPQALVRDSQRGAAHTSRREGGGVLLCSSPLTCASRRVGVTDWLPWALGVTRTQLTIHDKEEERLT